MNTCRKGPTIEITPPDYSYFTYWRWSVRGEGNKTESYLSVSNIGVFPEDERSYGLVTCVHISNLGKENKEILGIIKPGKHKDKNVVEGLADCIRKDAVRFAKDWNSRVKKLNKEGNLVKVLRE